MPSMPYARRNDFATGSDANDYPDFVVADGRMANILSFCQAFKTSPRPRCSGVR